MPKVVARVRNKVAAAPGVRLSADPLTVPPELAGQTALLIGYQITLPVSTAQPDLLGDDIQAAVKQAEQDLDDGGGPVRRFAARRSAGRESGGIFRPRAGGGWKSARSDPREPAGIVTPLAPTTWNSSSAK